MIAAEKLQALVAGIFAAAGLPDADAHTVAASLVQANLRGTDTHGVSRTAQYVEMIERGEINPKPQLSLRLDLPALAVLEADRAAGAVAMTRAADLAAQKARTAGAATVLVRRTTHTGAIGAYARRIAEQGMAGIVLSASAPLMVYHGALKAGVATNPIAIAVPGGARGPVVFDMASSVIPLGRILQSRKTGEPLPPDAAVDRSGQVTTDAMAAAWPLPLGGAKGSGLSLMIECVTSLALGSPILAEYLESTEASRMHFQNAYLMAMDLARLGDPETYAQELARLEADLKALPADPALGGILLPGDRGDRMHARRQAEGIPVPEAVLADLRRLATKLGIEAGI
jgi:ureidoglycolate dehydrogenase (NAD+)